MSSFAPKRLKDIPAIPVAVALMVVALVSFLAIFAFFVAQGIEQTSRRLEERAHNSVQIVSTNARWLREVAQQTLRRIDLALGPAMLSTPEQLVPVLEGIPPGAEIYIVDAEARTLYSSVPEADDVSVTDRQYFTELREDAKFHVSSLLISRLTGDQIFVFSKRVEREGQFAGAIMISFSTSILADFWATLQVEGASTISLLRSDGMLIARYPPTDGPLDLSDYVLFTDYLPQANSGIYPATSPVDDVERIVSYQHIPGTEIVAIASVDAGAAWEAFRRNVLIVFLIVSPIIVGLAVGSIWIVRLLYRDAARQHELEASLAENVLLFREIHHRVKNNLQSVQSLVRMQNIPESTKLDLQSRFAAMAAMHEHIYKRDAYADIVASEFVPSVVEPVLATYGSFAKLDYDVDPVRIDRDHGTPFALLLSELITNALKYAFPGGRAGRIRIELKALDNERCRLVVEDDGIGFSPAGATSSMGMRLIKAIVAQLNGTYRFAEHAGTRFEADLALQHAARLDFSEHGPAPASASTVSPG
ncbi:sensor histidine kinase [Devosia nitrariae]|uniref:sensor histidine kinase n=1 Tax=Devosia nitrariae TaxID=2071872 RepID=UPI0024E094E1|nr:histidine kinase dimerization/phosphoacceptor domain -containing protein [Devosia nitrariae]